MGDPAGEHLAFDGNGDLKVTGEINATSGSFTGAVVAGTGEDVAVIDGADSSYRIYAGGSTPQKSLFKVDKLGNIEASSAVLYDNDGNVVLDTQGASGSILSRLSQDLGLPVSETVGILTDEDAFITVVGMGGDTITLSPKIFISNESAASHFQGVSTVSEAN